MIHERQEGVLTPKQMLHLRDLGWQPGANATVKWQRRLTKGGPRRWELVNWRETGYGFKTENINTLRVNELLEGVMPAIAVVGGDVYRLQFARTPRGFASWYEPVKGGADIGNREPQRLMRDALYGAFAALLEAKGRK